jgi:hypothetical protein
MLGLRSCLVLLAVSLAGTIGCVTTQSNTQKDTQSNTQTKTQSKPQANAAAKEAPCTTKLSKIKVGMSGKEVHELVGSPTAIDHRPTANNWIPFYHGTDYMHTIEIYKGAGRVELDSDQVVAGVECNPSESGQR